jgi:hypothetical protein
MRTRKKKTMLLMVSDDVSHENYLFNRMSEDPYDGSAFI